MQGKDKKISHEGEYRASGLVHPPQGAFAPLPGPMKKCHARLKSGGFFLRAGNFKLLILWGFQWVIFRRNWFGLAANSAASSNNGLHSPATNPPDSANTGGYLA